MIVGIFLRNFKTYEGYNFIPLNNLKDLSSFFVGDNGCGKSSILEALDCFFNGKKWITTIEKRPNLSFCMPIFIVERDILSSLTEIEKKILNKIIKSIDEDSFSNISITNIDYFIKIKKIYENSYSSSHFLLPVYLMGIKSGFPGKSFFGEQKVPDVIDRFLKFQKSEFSKVYESFNEKLIKIIKKEYTYIYIPSEIPISEVLKINNLNIKNLIGLDILNKISESLERKDIESNRKKISILEILNDDLNKLVRNINNSLQEIYPGYEFAPISSGKQNLTSKDLRLSIIESFFEIRKFKRDSKQLERLSSGEQRKALIDTIISLVRSNKDRALNIIVSIDEPEISVSQKFLFEHFLLLNSIFSEPKFQMLITTHWYGSLLTNEKSVIVHIPSDKPKLIKLFDPLATFSDRAKLPNDVSFKSFFELSNSLLQSVKTSKTNWIVCEGVDDKMFINFYLKDEIDDLKVVSVDGSGNVIKIYDLLTSPFEADANEIKGKILFLIDSDEEIIIPSTTSKKRNNLDIRKIHFNKVSKQSELKKPGPRGQHFVTSIEDHLNPSLFISALKLFENFEETSKAIELDSKFSNSILRHRNNFISSKNGGHEFIESVQDFFLDHQNKFRFAEAYTRNPKGDIPKLFIEIKKLLND